MSNDNYNYLFALDIQQQILGVCLCYSEKNAVRDAVADIDPDAFASLDLRRAFKESQSQINRGKVCDLTSVSDAILTGDDAVDSDTFRNLAEIAKNTHSFANILDYKSRLEEYHQARLIVNSWNDTWSSINSLHKPDEIIELVSSRIDSISKRCEISADDSLIVSGSSGFDHKVDWLVKGWIPKESFGMLYAAPESYKSFQALDWAASISTGKDWSGNKVSRGSVLYIAGEGQVGLGGRVKAWEIVNKKDADNLYRLTKGVALDDLSGRKVVMSACEQIKKATGDYPVMIVIDTVNRCFGAGDENSTKDMTTFVSSCDYVKERTKATILCVHHTGKDVDKGARGSSVLSGACDFEYKMKRNPVPLSYILISSKAKDFERPISISVNLRVVDTGATDDDGDARTSLARSGDAKQASESEQSVSMSIAEQIMATCNKYGERPQPFIIDHVMRIMSMDNNDSSKAAIRREINKLVQDGQLEKNGNCVAPPFEGGTFKKDEF